MSAPFTADLDVAREETHAAWFGELSTARAELEELMKERRIGGTAPVEPDDTLGLRAELLLATDEVAEIKGALARERARVAHADGDEGFWAEMRDGLRRDLELAERETTVALEDLSSRRILPRSESLALERWAAQRATQAAGPPLRAAKIQEEDAAQDALLSAWQRELAARAAVADLERERGRAQERARQAAVAVSELEARLTASQMRM